VLIDCDGCAMRDLECDDCVVTVLLGGPPGHVEGTPLGLPTVRDHGASAAS